MAYHRISSLGPVPAVAHRGLAYSPYKLFLFGGFDGRSYLDDLLVFDLKSNQFETFTELSVSSRPCQRSHHLMQFLPPNYIIIYGGVFKSRLLNDSFLFNTSTYNWEQVLESDESPGRRYGMTAGVIGSTLYLFAGFGEKDGSPEQSLDDVWTFDYRSREWTPFNTLGTHRAVGTGWTCVPVFKQFFCFGSDMFRMNVLDTSSREWRPVGLSGTIPAKLEFYLLCKNESGSIFVFGGLGFDGAHGQTYSLDEADGNFVWHKLECTGAVPSARYGQAGLCIGDIVIVLGGRQADNYLQDVYAFNPNLGLRWLNLTALGQVPGDRVGHVAFYVKETNKILVHGGDCRGFVTNDLYLFDYSSHEWTQVPPSPDCPALAYHSSIYDGKRNRLVIYGGGNLKDCFSGVYTLSLPELAWAAVKPRKSIPPRAGHNSFLHPDEETMVVFAGFIPIEGYVNDLWLLNLLEPRWSSVSASSKSGTYPVGRVSSTCLVHLTSAYMFGGVNSEVVLDDLWKLNLQTWVWERISIYDKTPGCIYGHAGVLIENHVFVLTGDSNDANGEILKVPTSALLWSLSVSENPEWNRYKVEGSIMPRRFYSAVLVNNDIVIYGGGPDSGVYQLDRNDVEKNAESDDFFRDFVLPYSDIVDNILLNSKKRSARGKREKGKKAKEGKEEREEAKQESQNSYKPTLEERLETAQLVSRRRIK